MMIKKIFPFILIAYLGGCAGTEVNNSTPSVKSPQKEDSADPPADKSNAKNNIDESSSGATNPNPGDQTKPDTSKGDAPPGGTASGNEEKQQTEKPTTDPPPNSNHNPAEQLLLSLTTEKTKGGKTLSATIKNPPDDFQATVIDKGNTFSWKVKGYYEGDKVFSYKELRMVLSKEGKTEAEAVKHHFAVLYGINESKMKVDNNDIVIENFDANIFLKALFAMRNSDAIQDLVFNRVDEKSSIKEKK